MGETMRAAVVHAFGEPLTIDELPVPEPAPGEIVVRLAATGVCHTDLHAARGDWPVKPRCRSYRGTRAPALWPRSAPG